MINELELDAAQGHLESLECCIKNIVEELTNDLDEFSMVWDNIIVAQKELEMAKYIINTVKEDK